MQSHLKVLGPTFIHGGQVFCPPGFTVQSFGTVVSTQVAAMCFFVQSLGALLQTLLYKLASYLARMSGGGGLHWSFQSYPSHGHSCLLRHLQAPTCREKCILNYSLCQRL